jgi:hypothetical protein
MPADYSAKQLAFWEWLRVNQVYDLDKGGTRKGVYCSKKQLRTTYVKDGQTANGKANFRCKLCTAHKVSEDVLLADLRTQGYEFRYNSDPQTQPALEALDVILEEIDDVDFGPSPALPSLLTMPSSLTTSSLPMPETPMLPRTANFPSRGYTTPSSSRTSDYQLENLPDLTSRMENLTKFDARFHTMFDFFKQQFAVVQSDILDLKSILEAKDSKIAEQDAKIAELTALLKQKDAHIAIARHSSPPLQTSASPSYAKAASVSLKKAHPKPTLTKGQVVLQQALSTVAKNPRPKSIDPPTTRKVSELNEDDTAIISFRLKQSVQFRTLRLTLSRLGVDLSIIHSMCYGRHRTLNVVVQKAFAEELKQFCIAELKWKFMDPADLLKAESATSESIFRKKSIETKTYEFFLSQRSLYSHNERVDAFVKSFSFDTAKNLTSITDASLESLWEKASSHIKDLLSAKEAPVSSPSNPTNNTTQC